MVKTRRDLLATAAALLLIPGIGRAANGAAMTPAVEAEALAWVKANARTFSEDPESDELADVAKALTGAQVVGIGEASHGSHEDRLFKASLIRALIERGQARIIALECNFLPGRALNNYVQTGEGDPVQLMRANGFFETWRCEEMLDLITWARSWNLAGKPTVSIVGVDCQATGRDADFALTWLAEHDNGAASAKRDELAPVVGPDVRTKRHMDVVGGLSAEQMKAQIAAARGLVDILKAQPGWTGLAGHGDAFSAARAAHQGLVAFELETKGAPEPTDPNYYARRDQFMAENLLALTGAGTSVYWAHNTHVAPALGLFGSSETCGGYLRRAMGRAYRSVIFEYDQATLFAKSGPSGSSPPPASQPMHRVVRPSFPGTLGAALTTLKIERFWIDLATASDTAAAKAWVAYPYLHDWPGFYMTEGQLDPQSPPVALAGRVDVLVFLRQVTPARFLPFVKTA